MTEEKKYKVILVDDDDFLVNMYATKFGNSGILVEACKSGKTLLEKMQTMTDVDLILLDIVMPDINGIDILRNIRKEKTWEKVPVVMLTNQNDEKDISEAQKLGISGYIVKSAATPSEVVNEVMNIIKKTHN
jgi:twitching motility two-component system response regulator PilH